MKRTSIENNVMEEDRWCMLSNGIKFYIDLLTSFISCPSDWEKHQNLQGRLVTFHPFVDDQMGTIERDIEKASFEKDELLLKDSITASSRKNTPRHHSREHAPSPKEQQQQQVKITLCGAIWTLMTFLYCLMMLLMLFCCHQPWNKPRGLGHGRHT